MAKAILDPVTSGIPKAMARRTKGTPNGGKGAGTELQLNQLPPGMDIGNQVMASDTKRVAGIEPFGPIVFGTTSNRG